MHSKTGIYETVVAILFYINSNNSFAPTPVLNALWENTDAL